LSRRFLLKRISVSGGIEFYADDGRVSHRRGAGRQGGLEIEIGEGLRSTCCRNVRGCLRWDALILAQPRTLFVNKVSRQSP